MTWSITNDMFMPMPPAVLEDAQSLGRMCVRCSFAMINARIQDDHQQAVSGYWYCEHCGNVEPDGKDYFLDSQKPDVYGSIGG